MTAPLPQPDYESPPAPRRRSLGTWATLLVVWFLGLVSWAIYCAALFYLLL
jgi:hypothetical protein